MPLIAARLKKHGTILAAMITFALCLVVLGLLRHWLAALLAFAVLRAAFAVHSASYTVYSQEIVEPRRREVMSGSVLMAAGLGIGIISITGGFIIRSFDYRTLFLAAGLGIGRFAEGMQILYEASRAKGIPSGYILYRDEPHVLQRLENQRDLLNRSLEWVRRFISVAAGDDKKSENHKQGH